MSLLKKKRNGDEENNGDEKIKNQEASQRNVTSLNCSNLPEIFLLHFSAIAIATKMLHKQFVQGGVRKISIVYSFSI